MLKSFNDQKIRKEGVKQRRGKENLLTPIGLKEGDLARFKKLGEYEKVKFINDHLNSVKNREAPAK